MQMGSGFAREAQSILGCLLFIYLFIYLFFKVLFIYFLERQGEGERKGEKHQCARDTSISCFSHAPYWGSGPQPRHVP